MRTVADVVAATARQGSPLPAPEYDNDPPGGSVARHERDHVRPRFAFMVESMRTHMTDEGYQLALALGAGGYRLFGHGFNGCGDVAKALRYDPSVVVVQDKREWIGRTAGPGFDHRESFLHADELRRRPDVFRLTVLKDAHADATLHTEAANEIGSHGWVVYYHPDVVAAQAPFVRREHLVRTWHSVDPAAVPAFNPNHRSLTVGLLSGALSGAYPLRSRLALAVRNGQMRHLSYRRHPGYGRTVCYTTAYMQDLSTYRVAVCTGSRFGYSVRKIMEATACGCVVVTDLPTDDVLPEIDGNLVRIDSDTAPGRVDALVGELAEGWDAERQRGWAERAVAWYDYRALGRRLAVDIEALRRGYNGV